MTRLGDLPAGHPVVVDCETSQVHPDDGGHVAVVSFAYRDPADGRMVAQAVPFDQGLFSPLGDKRFDSGSHLDRATERRLKKWPEWALTERAPNRPPEDYLRLLDALEPHRLIFHNAKFDLMFLEQGLRGRAGRSLQRSLKWDTMLAQWVREPQMPKALKDSAVRLELTDSGAEDAEAEALKPWLGPKTGKNANPRYDLVPWSVMEPYARVDAELTLLLWEFQQERIDPDDPNFWRHFDEEMDFLHVLRNMERCGIGFDARGCAAAAAVLQAEQDAVAKLLPFRGGTGAPTPNAARKFFFSGGPEDDEVRPGTADFRGLAPFPDKMTKGGKTAPPQPQVDEETITRLVIRDVPFAQEYEQHEGLKSAISKWYGAWPQLCGADGRLRTSYKQGGTVSGRLAVSRVQLQAIPHDYLMPSTAVPTIRQFFRPRPGCELWEFDVSQAEIRLATAIARCQPMLDGILRGDDSHSIACKLMFGVDEDHPDWERYRQIAKRCNLGILYGAGAKVIREQLMKFAGMDVSLNQVRGWINDWKAAFEPFTAALQRAQEQAERWGFVRLHNGRERWFSDYEPSHKAMNQVVQGSLAEIMKSAMIKVDRLYPGELLLQIHDSIVCEIPIDRVEDRKTQITDLMRVEFERAVWKPWEPGGEPVLVPYETDAKQWK